MSKFILSFLAMLANQGISAQIDVSNRQELRRPTEYDCKVVPVTVDWKRKHPGYGAVRFEDSHRKIFMEQTKTSFPKTVQMIPRESITLAQNFVRPETRAQNKILNETKGRFVNPVIPTIRHYNYTRD